MIFGHYFTAATTRLFGTDKGLYTDVANKLTGYWTIYSQGPDFCFANFNDCNETECAGLYGVDGKIEGGAPCDLLALFESQVPGGDRLLLWGADNGAPRFYWRGVTPLWFIWRHRAPPAGPTAEEAATAEALVPRLRGAVIAGVKQGKSEGVYIEMLGRTMRARVVAADEKGIPVQAQGIEVPIAWSDLTLRRFYGIARKYTDNHKALAVFCRGMGLTEEAEREERLQ